MQSRYSIIDFNALSNNLITIKKLIGQTMVMPIIKANAYGHGLIPTGKTLQECNVDFLGVAFIQEAIKLRQAGIIIPILALGSISINEIHLFIEYNIDIMAASIEKLNIINGVAGQYKKKARVHLKLDTGLGRIGVRYSNAEDFFLQAMGLKNLHIVGVSSHFATSDEQDMSYMKEQCERFYEATLFFERHSLEIPIRHIANSGAIIQYKESYFDMVRPGIMLYGVYPNSWMKVLCQLKPVMSLYAKVVYFKVLLKHSFLSYNRTWSTDKNTRIITLPIGYGDGYPKALSNKGYVILRGKKYPIVGNICMDQLMVNIGDAQAFNGDEVVLIGRSEGEEITINDLADCYAGSPYELLVGLNDRVDRLYKMIEKNKIPEKNFLSSLSH